MNFSEYVKTNYNIKINDEKIEQALQGIGYCVEQKIPIFLIGNGGSAYSASHFAQDLVKLLDAHAWSLSDNWGTVTAIANDIDYEYVYSYQLPKFGKRLLLICISCSGNSKNILQAAKGAKWRGIPVLSFTGNDGGELSRWSSLEINVPTDNIFISESIHGIIFHYIIAELVTNMQNKGAKTTK